MKNENYLNTTLKALGSILVVLLPVLQFGFNTLPENVSSLYLNKQTFFLTSLITLLFSLFIIFAYRNKPDFAFVLDKDQEKKYRSYIDSIGKLNGNSQVMPFESPPFRVTANTVAFLLIFVFLFSSLSFIWLGVSYQGIVIPSIVSFFQSVIYICMFAAAVYVLMHYTYVEYHRKNEKLNREKRIQNAINLALENKAFKEMPSINFIGLVEKVYAMPAELIVQVLVNSKKYNIYTNLEADELYQVLEISE